MTPIEAIVDAFGYPALVYMAVCVGLWLLLWGCEVMFGWIRCALFGHQFDMDDLALTGLEHSRRVACECHRCGSTYYAHCGLDLPGKLRSKKKREAYQ